MPKIRSLAASFLVTLGSINIALACTIDDSTTGVGDSSGEYIGLVREHCTAGDQVFMNLLHPWMVRYVVHGICDMRFSVYVDDYVSENTDLKRASPQKWDERDSSVSCIYKGS